MARVVISEADILDALAAAAPGDGPKEARTLRELARDQRISERRVREALRVLQQQGRLKPHKVNRPRLDGSPFTCTAFTITPKKRT